MEDGQCNIYIERASECHIRTQAHKKLCTTCSVHVSCDHSVICHTIYDPLCWLVHKFRMQ